MTQQHLFVVGCGHSGTSLMAALMDAHRSIYTLPEESYAFIRNDAQSAAEKLKVAWANEDPGKSALVLCEKTPKHVEHIDAILKQFPNGRVIYMLRDGRDVAVSIKARIDDFDYGIQRWIDDNAELLTWAQHPQVRIVRYEGLVADARAILTATTDWLNIPFDNAMTQHHRTKRAWYGADGTTKPPDATKANHTAYRSWQINQPIFDGRGRWKSLMSPEERKTFDQRAGDLLIALGYELNRGWVTATFDA